MFPLRSVRCSFAANGWDRSGVIGQGQEAVAVQQKQAGNDKLDMHLAPAGEGHRGQDGEVHAASPPPRESPSTCVEGGGWRQRSEPTNAADIWAAPRRRRHVQHPAALPGVAAPQLQPLMSCDEGLRSRHARICFLVRNEGESAAGKPNGPDAPEVTRNQLPGFRFSFFFQQRRHNQRLQSTQVRHGPTCPVTQDSRPRLVLPQCPTWPPSTPPSHVGASQIAGA